MTPLKLDKAKLQRFKSRPFSTNPIKNLGDKRVYSVIFQNMMNNAGGIEGIKQLKIREGHKLTLLRQIQYMNKLVEG